MEYINVQSSNIHSIGYEENNLYIRFKNNTEYKYINVPEDIFENLKKAESKGKYINESIKRNYSYEKIK